MQGSEASSCSFPHSGGGWGKAMDGTFAESWNWPACTTLPSLLDRLPGPFTHQWAELCSCEWATWEAKDHISPSRQHPRGYRQPRCVPASEQGARDTMSARKAPG